MTVDNRNRSEVSRLLGGVPIFAGIKPRQLRRLAARSTVRAYRPGDVIVREGDTCMSFYVILSGAARIVRQSGGGEVVMDHLAVGGFFGEMGLLDDLPRLATVVATEPTECALVGKWDIEAQFRDDATVSAALTLMLMARIRGLEDRLLGASVARAQNTAPSAVLLGDGLAEVAS